MTGSTITLSFAELAFVLSLADVDGGKAICVRLGVPNVRSDDQLASAGLASLALRGLARQRESSLELSPEVAAVCAGLLSASQTATVAVTHDEATIVTQLFVGDVQSMAVRRVALGCYQFDGLSDEATLSKVVSSLFASALNDGRSAVAAMVDDRTSITAVNGDGSVVVAIGDEVGTTVDLVDIEDTIGSILANPAGRTE